MSTPDPRNDPLVQELLEGTEVPVGKKENKQLFENSSLRESEAMEYYGSKRQLFGDKPPNLAIKSERPEHRLIVYLKARGMTNQEIADQTGYGYQWVCQIVRQPWFRAAFAEACAEAGQDVVKQFLQGEVIPSLETLKEVRDSEKALSSSRINAANSLLDRFLGKPTQHVEVEKSTSSLDDAKKTNDQLERELQALRAQNGFAESTPPQS